MVLPFTSIIKMVCGITMTILIMASVTFASYAGFSLDINNKIKIKYVEASQYGSVYNGEKIPVQLWSPLSIWTEVETINSSDIDILFDWGIEGAYDVMDPLYYEFTVDEEYRHEDDRWTGIQWVLHTTGEVTVWMRAVDHVTQTYTDIFEFKFNARSPTFDDRPDDDIYYGSWEPDTTPIDDMNGNYGGDNGAPQQLYYEYIQATVYIPGLDDKSFDMHNFRMAIAETLSLGTPLLIPEDVIVLYASNEYVNFQIQYLPGNGQQLYEDLTSRFINYALTCSLENYSTIPPGSTCGWGVEVLQGDENIFYFGKVEEEIDEGLALGAIIGIAVALVVLVIVLIVGCICFWQVKKKRNQVAAMEAANAAKEQQLAAAQQNITYANQVNEYNRQVVAQQQQQVVQQKQQVVAQEEQVNKDRTANAWAAWGNKQQQSKNEREREEIAQREAELEARISSLESRERELANTKEQHRSDYSVLESEHAALQQQYASVTQGSSEATYMANQIEEMKKRMNNVHVQIASISAEYEQNKKNLADAVSSHKDRAKQVLAEKLAQRKRMKSEANPGSESPPSE